MRHFHKLLAVLIVATAATACSDLADNDHYKSSKSAIDNPELSTSELSSEQYIKSRSDLSSMNRLFEENGIYEELNKKGQLSTMLVVQNDNFSMPEEKEEYVTRSHVSDIYMSPAYFTSEKFDPRLMMWHGKYVSINLDEAVGEGLIVEHVKFNNATVKEVVKTNNGYIYVISNMIDTPMSLYDYIEELGEDYSIFRDMVKGAGGREFDKKNSKAIGVNAEGNTVYDSVWVYKSDFFEGQNFYMDKESTNATMLLFSNKVINDALDDVHQRLAKWGLTRNDSIIKDWILKTAFFAKRYTPEEMKLGELDLSGERQDLTNIFYKEAKPVAKWRPSKQEVDTDNPIELSNATVYNVTKLYIPNNVLIYRLKSWFYFYESCDAVQKEEYFKMTNMVFKQVKEDVAPWTPLEGIFPFHGDTVMICKTESGETAGDGFTMEHTLIRKKADGTVEPFLVPPGKYRLAMGFKQNMGVEIKVRVVAGGQDLGESPLITLGSKTDYHYDRGATLKNTYPEWYDTNDPRITNNKKQNYDTDGGPIFDEIEIPDLKGDNSPLPIVLVIKCDDWKMPSDKTSKDMYFTHWCLRPTVNDY